MCVGGKVSASNLEGWVKYLINGLYDWRINLRKDG